MSAKSVKDNKSKKTDLDKKEYKNPVETKWGKITIWILLFGMIGIVIISAVWVIVQAIIGN